MTKAYRVELTESALADVAEIRDSIEATFGLDVATQFLADVEAAVDALELFPDRGSIPTELAGLGVPIRQRPIGPYRAIYRVGAGVVSILLVVHSRQSLQLLLEQRILRR